MSKSTTIRWHVAGLAHISIIFMLMASIAIPLLRPLAAHAQTPPSLYYNFNFPGNLYQASSSAQSSSPYLWLNSGGHLMILPAGVGVTEQGTVPLTNYWHIYYAANFPVQTDNGAHPQNMFQMLTKDVMQGSSAQIYVNRKIDNLSNPTNRYPYNGESIIMRYRDSNNYYYAGIRADGNVVIKKKSHGVYQTLAIRKVFLGIFNPSTNPDLIPLKKWMGIRLTVEDTLNGPKLSFYMDIDRTGYWERALSVVDDPARFGDTITAPGRVGIVSDFADAQFDDLLVGDASDLVPKMVATSLVSGSYDATILRDSPVMYLSMGTPSLGRELDRSGHGHIGLYVGGAPINVAMPNGDVAADFNGLNQYLTASSSAEFSIPTTHELTWEAWIRPDTLQFIKETGEGYVNWMGKCQNFAPTCEWEARMYSLVTPENRPNRISAYALNKMAHQGSGAAWQPLVAPVQAGQWLHVVAEYQTETTPSICSSVYPGTITIWVNGIKRGTGCMSQYSVIPEAGSSPLNVGTVGMDSWFQGAIGKVAIYGHLLTQEQISSHFEAMTGIVPGSM